MIDRRDEKRALAGAIQGYTISVPSLADSTDWYATKFGFHKLAEFAWPGIGQACTMKGPGFHLEIVEPTKPKPQPLSESHPDTGNSVHGHKHFCLSTFSIARAVKEMELAGVQVVCVKEVADLAAAFVKDNAGCLIELLENKAAPLPMATDGERSGSQAIAQKLHHVAISVPSCAEACDWYAEALGLAKVAEFEIPAVGLKVAMMAGDGGTVEVFEAANASPLPEHAASVSSDLATIGNKFFTFSVADLEEASIVLGMSNVKMTEPETVGGLRRAFIRDNSGLAIQLRELSM